MGFFVPSQFSVGGQFGDYQVVIGGPGTGPGGGGQVVYLPGAQLPPQAPVYNQQIPQWVWLALIAAIAFLMFKK